MVEHRVSYSPKDLKEEYESLRKFNDFTLVPVFDRVAHRFFDDLNHNYPKYGVSDGRPVERHGGGLMDYVSPSYNIVIDGKIITITLHDTNIDVKDDDEMWWMTESIIFEGTEEQVNKMLQHVKNFTKQQKLEELIEKSRTELKKGKTYHLDREMRDFYFEYSPAQLISQR